MSGNFARGHPDVGAGEGSVLEELSTLGFAKRYWAAEISSSGVATIEARGIANLTEVVKFDGYSLPYEDLKFDLYQVSLIRTHFNETLCNIRISVGCGKKTGGLRTRMKHLPCGRFHWKFPVRCRQSRWYAPRVARRFAAERTGLDRKAELCERRRDAYDRYLANISSIRR